MNEIEAIALAVLAVIVFFSIGVFAAVKFVHYLDRLPSPREHELKQEPTPSEPNPRD